MKIGQRVKVKVTQESNNYFTVWADEGLTEYILEVDGVAGVSQGNTNTNYLVKIDERFDSSIVIENLVKILVKLCK